MPADLALMRKGKAAHGPMDRDHGNLASEVRGRGLQAEREFVTVQQLFRREGPDAYGLDAAHLAGAPSWEQVETACRPDLFIEIGGRRLWVELEIRPGCTIVFRRGRLE